MKPLFGYLFLAIGISCGIVANSFAKVSEGFSKLTPSILCILFMCVTMVCIAFAIQTIVIHINKIHKTDGVNLENPSETFAKLFEAIPQDIPIARNKYPNKGFIILIKKILFFNYLRLSN